MAECLQKMFPATKLGAVVCEVVCTTFQKILQWRTGTRCMHCMSTEGVVDVDWLTLWMAWYDQLSTTVPLMSGACTCIRRCVQP